VSFLDKLNILVLGALVGSGIPVVVSERSEPQYRSLGLYWGVLRSWYYPRARRVVMLSEAALPWAQRRWPRWRTEAIANPVVVSPPNPSFSKPTWFGERTVIAMGRLHPIKGF